jgi:hypothetical protein
MTLPIAVGRFLESVGRGSSVVVAPHLQTLRGTNSHSAGVMTTAAPSSPLYDATGGGAIHC